VGLQAELKNHGKNMSRNQRALLFTSECPTIFWVELFPEDLNTGWSFYELYELRLHDINVRI
jgi:hypothetical protein